MQLERKVDVALKIVKILGNSKSDQIEKALDLQLPNVAPRKSEIEGEALKKALELAQTAEECGRIIFPITRIHSAEAYACIKRMAELLQITR